MGLFGQNSALLIIDMIYDFVHPEGALLVPDARGIIDQIRELAGEARSLDLPVIYVNDSHDPDDEEFKHWPKHAVEDTKGSEVIEELEPVEGDYVLPKKKFSVFFETDLDDLLKKLNVRHLVLTGTVTNICILASAMEAVMRGYDITVPRAAVAALTDEEHEFALGQIENVFGGEVA